MATPFSSVQYHEEVERDDPDVREFFRLFMLPGVVIVAAALALTMWIGSRKLSSGWNGGMRRTVS